MAVFKLEGERTESGYSLCVVLLNKAGPVEELAKERRSKPEDYASEHKQKLENKGYCQIQNTIRRAKL